MWYEARQLTLLEFDLFTLLATPSKLWINTFYSLEIEENDNGNDERREGYGVASLVNKVHLGP